LKGRWFRGLGCLALSGPMLMIAASARGQTTPVIVWGDPGPIPFGTPLSAVQLNATATVSGVVPVSLANVFNVEGIVTDGTIYTGGYDSSGGDAFSASQLSGSLAWNGVTFPLGAANQPDAVWGVTIPLPAGSYGSLRMLGSLVNDELPPTGTFTVTYTDGSTTTLTQSLSDWVFPMNFPGESLVNCGPMRNLANGGFQRDNVCVYGYEITLDSTKTVKSVTLPADRNIVILAMALVTPPVAGTMTYAPAGGTVLASGTQTLTAMFTPATSANYNTATATVPLTVLKGSAPVTPVINWPAEVGVIAGTALSGVQLDATATSAESVVQVPLFPISRFLGISKDGQAYSENSMAAGVAYSATQLGGGIEWQGTDYLVGAPDVPDIASSVTIPLPPGMFGAVKFLGAATTAQTAQSFVVTYTDGTQTTVQQSMSGSTQSSGFAGESLVLSTSYADTSTGGESSGVFNVYGYSIPLNTAKTAASLTMPNNLAVGILALGLDPQTNAPVAGSFVYAPAAGTLLLAGTDPLAATFTPIDTTDYLGATATNSIVVTGYPLVLTANNATRVYGTANPVFTGTITGAVSAAPVTESFSTAAGTLSAVGQYAIVPSAVGSNVAAYVETIVDGTLTVTQAQSSLTLGVSQNAIYQAQDETLTANVLSVTTGTPTGAVNFFDNGTLLGAVTLVNGQASLTTAALPPGVNLITTTYGGDINFKQSSSGTAVSVTVTGLDFTLQALNGNTLTTVTGGTPTLTLTLTPLYGSYASTVQFAVSGSLPYDATYAFSPTTVAANGGSAQIVFTLYSHKLSRLELGSGAGAVLALLVLPVVLGRRQMTMRLLVMLIALGGLVGMSGCGWGYADERYPFTVTATSGAFQHSVNLVLHIEASGP
jgi:hypothetical protein